MRLKILNSDYSFSTKVLFALIQAISRQPLPDAAKLVFYRPEFYGAPMKEFTQEAITVVENGKHVEGLVRSFGQART